MNECLVLAAAVLMALSGVPGLALDRRSDAGPRIATGMILVACIVGLVGAVSAISGVTSPSLLEIPWSIPGGSFALRVDALSGFFLVPLFIVAACSSIYGLGYWQQSTNDAVAPGHRAFFGLCTAGMAVVFSAHHAMTFLLGWEAMAIGAFMLVVSDSRSEEARRAGWVYLVASHTATLTLIGFFGALIAFTGGMSFDPITQAMPAQTGNLLFVLLLLGFGLKAGLMPLHSWLPGAHAAAPAHVSALMSGVLLKTGIYGLARFTMLLPTPPAWWGWTLLVMGLFSAVSGAVFSALQRDLKRLLAYSSVEHLGIVASGLGFALIGRAAGQPVWQGLGFAAAMFHVWNHAAFKALLFLGAGSVMHGTGTRDMEQMGGLMKRLPWTGRVFAVGAVAACALPPLNGFASEVILYLGFLRSFAEAGSGFGGGAFAAAALALTGALGLVAFVNAFGIVFLGEARAEASQHAHEAGPAMRWPMVLLAGCCVVLGVFPWLVLAVLEPTVVCWSGGVTLPAIPLLEISVMNVALIAIGAAVWWGMHRLAMAWPVLRPGTWDCGFVGGTPRIQYTAASFSQLVAEIFHGLAIPRQTVAHPAGFFPAPGNFEQRIPDTVLDRLILPAFRGAVGLSARARVLQQGHLQAYLLYILLTLVVLLLW